MTTKPESKPETVQKVVGGRVVKTARPEMRRQILEDIKQKYAKTLEILKDR
ncbi:MAG: hypothetical protein ACFB2Z_14930 [Maricaulaceae bacterium]